MPFGIVDQPIKPEVSGVASKSSSPQASPGIAQRAVAGFHDHVIDVGLLAPLAKGLYSQSKFHEAASRGRDICTKWTTLRWVAQSFQISAFEDAWVPKIPHLQPEPNKQASNPNTTRHQDRAREREREKKQEVECLP